MNLPYIPVTPDPGVDHGIIWVRSECGYVRASYPNLPGLSSRPASFSSIAIASVRIRR